MPVRDYDNFQALSLMPPFNPFRYAGSAGNEEILPPLPDVPGSVEMLHRTHFDALKCRWIDEWIPTAAPENALSQTIRCYTPGDLSLLLKGTGLTLKRIEVDSQVIDPTSTEITKTINRLFESHSSILIY